MQAEQPWGPLLLAGGGHTHALVLLRWAMARQQPSQPVTLVSRAGTVLYSGMVPGVLAGLYDRDACTIDLRRLCRMAGVSFIAAEITGINLSAQQLELQGRPPLHWQWLSLDVGAVTPGHGQRGAKPLEPFLAWADQQPPHTAAAPLAIRGGGAAAVEVALALRGRGHSVTLLLRGQRLHLGTKAANRLGEGLLQDASIAVERHVPASQPAAVACTGSVAPAWLAAAGLPSDDHGRVLTLPTLQVVGYPQVFATGDCAVLPMAPRPPSGVWAVRAAPTLAVNLERCLRGAPAWRLQHWRPQRWALQLLADGSQPRTPRAIALWGPLSLGPSHWLWRWKDRIDRRFMQRFQRLRPMASATAMACRGCAAKLAAPALRAGLSQAGHHGSAEDAALVDRTQKGKLLLQSVDGFPALVDDGWLNARLTTLHACSDLWACGAEVTSVQALVTVPATTTTLQQDCLAQTLAGIRSILDPMEAQLIGGHTLEARDGAGLALSLSVNGVVPPERHWGKGPLQPGQGLILTRPLGTGVLFAAAMAGAARATWIEQALEQMQQSQAVLVDCLHDMGCQACTDITGFGLLGHLGEMLTASAVDLQVQLNAAAIPALPGVLELLDQGYASTLAPANARALELLKSQIHLSSQPLSASLQGLLIDPQTCGPLLAAVPATAIALTLARLRKAGFSQAALVARVITQDGRTGLRE